MSALTYVTHEAQDARCQRDSVGGPLALDFVEAERLGGGRYAHACAECHAVGALQITDDADGFFVLIFHEPDCRVLAAAGTRRAV